MFELSEHYNFNNSFSSTTVSALPKLHPIPYGYISSSSDSSDHWQQGLLPSIPSYTGKSFPVHISFKNHFFVRFLFLSQTTKTSLFKIQNPQNTLSHCPSGVGLKENITEGRGIEKLRYKILFLVVPNNFRKLSYYTVKPHVSLHMSWAYIQGGFTRGKINSVVLITRGACGTGSFPYNQR